MNTISPKLILAASAIFCICASAFGQMKSNDFTSANKSFSKTYNAERRKTSEEKSRFSDEKFDSKKYEVRDEIKIPRENKYVSPEDPMADIYNGQRSQSNREKADVPERTVFREEWTQNKDLDLYNKDRTLNRAYSGRSDFSKHHPLDAKMKETYEQMNERSMQDVNKYMFSASHSGDAGLPVAIAGEQIHEDENSSFLDDFLFGGKEKRRSPVSFKKNMDVGVTAPPASPSKNIASQAPMPAGVNVLPPLVIGEKQNAKSPPAEPKTKVYEEVTDKVLMETSEKGLRRGKTTIKVEIGEPKY